MRTELYKRTIQELSPTRDLPVTAPTTDAELKEAVSIVVGIDIPNKAVCENHCSPFQAFADAYFGRYSTTVWKASRGFGGKSIMLATLSYLETVFLGAAVNLLGGSGEQSQRVHSYITGEDTNLPDTFWGHPNAPVSLLKTDPTKMETSLKNGGRLKVLMASQKSVRGPHPQRLRIDEVDEVDIDIFDAALGQPMEARGIMEQTVLSSTHQHAAGTMTEVLKRAADKGWPVYEWCWRESATLWLTLAQVERKRSQVSNQMWNVEYEMQTPNPGARAIDEDALTLMFDRSLGDVEGEIGKEYIFEPPIEGATYAHGADWARKNDYTVIITYRTDEDKIRIVSFERTHKQPWPVMVNKLDKRIALYGGAAAHDATGLGDVIAGYLLSDVEDVEMVGRRRSKMLNDYITAIESQEIISPYIEFMHKEHLYASVDDIYKGGSDNHLPDTISAAALGHLAQSNLGWVRGMAG